jgi:penicillin-binding protein 2
MIHFETQHQFSERKFIIGGVIVLVSLAFLCRLFFLQLIDDSYKLSSENNSQRQVTQYPARGIVFDRNNKILVYNEAAYDLMVIPRQLKQFDTLDFCTVLEISKEQVRKSLKEAKNYSKYRPSIFLKQLSPETYAVFQEKQYKFPGFFVQARTLRKYPQKIAAHLLGYIGEVDENTSKENKYYKAGDYIGISGIEKSYEEELRGTKGVSIFLVDVHNMIKGSYKNGKYDTLPVPGLNIVISIDAELQAYGERLMQNKIGSIVAIEPSTGEILALVSSPAYDPNLLVGRVRTTNFQKLSEDTVKPLFNRALMAKYPPGSTFKLINGMIALQEGVIDLHTTFSCNMGYHAGGITVGCHKHSSPLDYIGSIQNSCNAYYCNVFRNILDDPAYNSVSRSFSNWRRHVVSFGFGSRLGSDLMNELPGFIPNVDYYDKYFGKNHWKSLTVISLAIGQGELGITPLQMTNMTAAIANRGYYFIPHIIKKIEGKKSIDKKFTTPHFTTINKKYFEFVVEGMEKVVTGGTARVAYMDSISICGKTGTAQNPHGDDHSIFIAFAPKDSPRIAMAVYVENGGFGSIWAAPIARLMIEKYLTDTITIPELEVRILEGNLLNPGKVEKGD